LAGREKQRLNRPVSDVQNVLNACPIKKPRYRWATTGPDESKKLPVYPQLIFL
jgi:hypothetical protein